MKTQPTPRLAAPCRIPPGLSFSLPEGMLMHLAPAGPGHCRPWRVEVQAGAVWLTWAGCQDDVFLSAGEAAELPAGVQALAQVEPRLARGAAVLSLRLLRTGPGGAMSRPNGAWAWRPRAG